MQCNYCKKSKDIAAKLVPIIDEMLVRNGQDANSLEHLKKAANNIQNNKDT